VGGADRLKRLSRATALQRPPLVTPPLDDSMRKPPKAPWRRPTLRKIDARDASAKGRPPHDMLHLS
jgi:hypothetical protein